MEKKKKLRVCTLDGTSWSLISRLIRAAIGSSLMSFLLVVCDSAWLLRYINSGINYAAASSAGALRHESMQSREHFFLLVAVSATRALARASPSIRLRLVRARICIRSEFNVLRFGVHAHRWRHSHARVRAHFGAHLEHACACTHARVQTARERPRRIR